MLRLISDSTCNLPQDVIDAHAIRIAPIAIQFGNQTYEEGVDIDHDLFYGKIEELGIIPTTSQPSPAWFARFYQELGGDPILVVTVTSKHSGTYDSALLAKTMVPEADVEVFDSRSISLGTGWMLLEAARAAKTGQDRASILQRLGEIRGQARLFLTPATLKYLQMSGRVGHLQGALASLLNVKPIIYLRDGELSAGENVRTRRRAVDRLLDLMEESMGAAPINMAVIHARAPDEARALLDKARRRLQVREALSGELAASLAVHGGPGVIGLFGYPV